MSTKLRIIMAQQNFCVGDFAGNTKKIIEAVTQARDELHSDVIVFPELALCGYPPEDLLLRPDFYLQTNRALEKIKQAVIGIDVVLGYPQQENGAIYNAVCVIRHNKIIQQYYKQRLPNYGVFDEQRYFSVGSTPCIFTSKGISVGIIICEDLWHAEPLAQAVKAGAQLILCPNASPFDLNKADGRISIMRQRVAENHIPIIYVHGVGGQDDFIFDGGSTVIDGEGKICVEAEFYQEQLIPVDIELTKPLKIIPTILPKSISLEARVYQALVLGVRDYIAKNNFPGVLIGVSGGIDSALTLAIAVDALGKDRVRAVILPSRFTSELSMKLANDLVQRLGVQATTISIESSFASFLTDLAPTFAGLPVDKTEENLQARCRGIIMMAISNKTGKIVLTTGNKSEMAVGYATLYGDMAGGFAVLKDVYKTWVYKLSHYRNAISHDIPDEIITRPPTAELAHDQKDEDTLPPYETLDKILELYIEQDKSLADIVALGFDQATVRRVLSMVDKNEYKRRQAAIGPRITTRSFGRERRYPITSKYS